MIDPEVIAKKVLLTLESEDFLSSPCISVCRMDARTGWCVGCLRRLEEIARWSSLNGVERRAVWQCIGERAAQLQAGVAKPAGEGAR
jgi:predicted Fe-S protein YdhL (DUF1289 family)